MFIGLKKLCSNHATELKPEDLNEGDRLVLEFPFQRDWDSSSHLRQLSGLTKVITVTLEEKPEWGMGELRQRIDSAKVEECTTSQVIRFRK